MTNDAFFERMEHDKSEREFKLKVRDFIKNRENLNTK
jgi:hypothetical protein